MKTALGPVGRDLTKCSEGTELAYTSPAKEGCTWGLVLGWCWRPPNQTDGEGAELTSRQMAAARGAHQDFMVYRSMSPFLTFPSLYSGLGLDS